MRILVYGGSFDPPHEGHIRSVRAAAEALKPEKIFLIPASVPPHKTQSPEAATAQQRLQMTELAARALEDVGAETLDMELHRPGKSYTADTVTELKARYPEEELVFLLGTDMLLSFLQWHEPETILQKTSLAYFSRKGKANPAEAAMIETLREKYAATVYEIPGAPVEISSTTLRQQLKNRLGRELIPEAVYAYILQNRLYGARPELTWLRERAYTYLKPKRVAHVRGAEQEAVRLAERWGISPEDAAEAAICHDMTKKLEREEQLRLCAKYAIITDAYENASEKLLHAKTGAALAGDVFGLSPAVCSAINWHTTGKPDMTDLERIIYLADYIEPGREGFDGLGELRRAAYEDLDAAMELGMRMSILEVREKGYAPHANTVDGHAFYLARLHERGISPVHASGISDTI